MKLNNGSIITCFVISIALLTACQPTNAPASSIAETAITPEIDQLVNDYFSAFNNYDADAARAVITDGYVLVMDGSNYSTINISEPACEAYNSKLMLNYVDGYNKQNEYKFERLGEPIMSGNGPWLVAQVIHHTSKGNPKGVDGISTLTIVDEDGTLKVARDIFVGFQVK